MSNVSNINITTETHIMNVDLATLQRLTNGKTASDVIRAATGSVITVEELKSVKGVGFKTLDKIINFVNAKGAPVEGMPMNSEEKTEEPKSACVEAMNNKFEEVKMTKDEKCAEFMKSLMGDYVKDYPAFMASINWKWETTSQGVKHSLAFKPEVYAKAPRRCDEIITELIIRLKKTDRKAWRRFGAQWIAVKS